MPWLLVQELEQVQAQRAVTENLAHGCPLARRATRPDTDRPRNRPVPSPTRPDIRCTPGRFDSSTPSNAEATSPDVLTTSTSRPVDDGTLTVRSPDTVVTSTVTGPIERRSRVTSPLTLLARTEGGRPSTTVTPHTVLSEIAPATSRNSQSPETVCTCTSPPVPSSVT